MPDTQIRRFAPHDLEKVVSLWHESKRSSFSYVQVQQSYTREDDRNYFKEVILAECDVWVAVRNTRIVGFLAIKDDLIDQLFIAVAAQRTGVGSKFIKKARSLSPDLLRAFTFQKNQSARAFFEKHGFVPVRFGVSPPPEEEPDVEYKWTRI